MFVGVGGSKIGFVYWIFGFAGDVNSLSEDFSKDWEYSPAASIAACWWTCKHFGFGVTI